MLLAIQDLLIAMEPEEPEPMHIEEPATPMEVEEFGYLQSPLQQVSSEVLEQILLSPSGKNDDEKLQNGIQSIKALAQTNKYFAYWIKENTKYLLEKLAKSNPNGNKAKAAVELGSPEAMEWLKSQVEAELMSIKRLKVISELENALKYFIEHNKYKKAKLLLESEIFQNILAQPRYEKLTNIAHFREQLLGLGLNRLNQEEKAEVMRLNQEEKAKALKGFEEYYMLPEDLKRAVSNCDPVAVKLELGKLTLDNFFAQELGFNVLLARAVEARCIEVIKLLLDRIPIIWIKNGMPFFIYYGGELEAGTSEEKQNNEKIIALLKEYEEPRLAEYIKQNTKQKSETMQEIKPIKNIRKTAVRPWE